MIDRPQPPISPAGPPLRPRRRSPWKPILIAVGVVIAVLLVFIGLGVAFLLTAKELPVTEAEREAVLDASELGDWIEEFVLRPEGESLKKLRYFDGSHDIEYEYDADDLYLACTLNFEGKRSDAVISYNSIWLGAKAGTKIGGLRVDERDDLFSWGESSKFAILRTEVGDPVGNLFIARQGNRTFFIDFVGVYFDEADAIRELLEPALTAFESYQP